MSRLTVGSLEGLSENSNVISVPTGHTLNVADAGALQIGGSGVVSAGLVHISRTTIGTAVSSVTLSSIFSVDYDHYRVIIHTESTSNNTACLGLLGAATTNYNGYVWTAEISWGSATSTKANTTAGLMLGYFDNTRSSGSSNDILSPYLAKETYSFGHYHQDDNAGFAVGRQTDSTSFTDFTVKPATGTMTGGTIDVYGYAKA